jgi:hypothetical protein
MVPEALAAAEDALKDERPRHRPEVEYYSVTPWEVAFMRLLHDLASTEPFTPYLERAGFAVEG